MNHTSHKDPRLESVAADETADRLSVTRDSDPAGIPSPQGVTTHGKGEAIAARGMPPFAELLKLAPQIASNALDGRVADLAGFRERGVSRAPGAVLPGVAPSPVVVAPAAIPPGAATANHRQGPSRGIAA